MFFLAESGDKESVPINRKTDEDHEQELEKGVKSVDPMVKAAKSFNGNGNQITLISKKKKQ